jgi:hypothetical protein
MPKFIDDTKLVHPVSNAGAGPSLRGSRPPQTSNGITAQSIATDQMLDQAARDG